MSKWRVVQYYDGKVDADGFLLEFDTEQAAEEYAYNEAHWDIAALGEEEAERYTYVIEEVDAPS